jgi:alpha-tubulin suppressor-like RCC1 family protein
MLTTNKIEQGSAKYTLKMTQTIICWGENHALSILLLSSVNMLLSVMTSGLIDTGDNAASQLQVASEEVVTKPVFLKSDVHFVHLCSGSAHCVGLSSSGEVFAWGLNDRGQLGHGDLWPRSTPIRLESLSTKHISAVTAGEAFAFAVTQSGDAFSWGANDKGQLGVGLTPPLPLP